MKKGFTYWWAKKSCRWIFVVMAMIVPAGHLFATDQPRSLALKDLAPERSPFRLQPDHSPEKLWDEFMLVRRANAGDAEAEHELGLRYLMGEGFRADTTKAVFWIRKAADQNLLSARYNLAILLNNGWGVEWDPFEAYRHFQYSARHGFVEAQYVYGLLMTDNLAVSRNYAEAYRWIKSAADSGYAPAKETLLDFEKRGIMTRIRMSELDSSVQQASPSKANRTSQPTIQPLDFDLASDSTVNPDDGVLLKDALAVRSADSSGGESHSPLVETAMDAKTTEFIRAAAEAGSPEALTVMGRWYEQGTGVRKDMITASLYYLRAIRFDSPWSPVLLWRMIHTEKYFSVLKQRVEENDRDAQFVWAGLTAFGFDHQLTEPQALEFLQLAAKQQSIDALNELAICNSSGYWVRHDREKAVMLLKEAEQLGSRESKIRLSFFDLKDGVTQKAGENLVRMLANFARDGSVLAQAMLGYCFKEGKGVSANVPTALRLCREAARRGSRIAYDALRQMYDDRRPAGPEFQIRDSM